MKRHILHNLLLFAAFVVLLCGCAGSSVAPGQTSSAPSGQTPSANVPVASPPADVVQLKPEGTVPSSCPVTPVYQGGPATISGTDGIPWIQAEPATSAIRGILFYGQTSPNQAKGTYRLLHAGGGWGDGTNTKILWSIDSPQSKSPLQINGTNLSDSTKTFHQTVQGAVEIPSIVVVPSAGCWRLQLISGEIEGTLVMWVVG